MLKRRLIAALGITALWSLWALCILLILPVLLSVPGKPGPGDLALYIAVLGAVTTYPVLLPALTVLAYLARRRPGSLAPGVIRTATWTSFCGVVAILAALGGAFYAHERARPVLSREELFANSYANAILRQDTAWMDRIMAEGAAVDHPMSRGETPALMAAGFEDWSLVLFLLGRGADPDRRDDRGNSVRALAASPRAAPKNAAEASALDRVRARLAER